MDPILAAGVVSLGREVLDRFMPSSKSAAPVKFQNVLNAQQTAVPTASAPAIADPVALARRIDGLEHSLANTAELNAFLRGDGLFKLQSDGGDFLVERENGETMRLAGDTPAGALARQLVDLLKTQQQTGAGNQAASEPATAWTVVLSTSSHRSSSV